MPEQAKREAIAEIDKFLRAGRLQHRVTQTVPLSDCARGHELIEQGGFRGCVVVTLEG